MKCSHCDKEIVGEPVDKIMEYVYCKACKDHFDIMAFKLGPIIYEKIWKPMMEKQAKEWLESHDEK